MMKWLWIILAVIYLLSPYDLIPGMHALGWIDDLAILVLLYRYLSRFRRRGAPDDAPEGNGRQQDHTATNGTAPRRLSPHEVLGVSPGASKDEIKAAYRTLVGQYHPDKVAHLGEELQSLAEQRFKEIQDAYETLMR